MRRWLVCLAVLLASCSSGELKVVRQVHDGVTAFQHTDVKPEQLVVINAVEYRGRFTRSEGCLELVSDGKRYTPVFNNPEHLQNALRDSAARAQPRLWSIAGGPAQDRLRVSARILGRCQEPLFMVVSLSDPRPA
jgi:hypothetical protein